VRKHVGGVERRVVDHGPARLEDAEEGDHVVRRVRQEQAHVHPRADADLLQALGGAVGERVELAVGDPLVHELERRPVGPLDRGVDEDLLQRLGLDLDVPADARGVRLDPGHVFHVHCGSPCS
jgi:hypothetical protein